MKHPWTLEFPDATKPVYEHPQRVSETVDVVGPLETFANALKAKPILSEFPDSWSHEMVEEALMNCGTVALWDWNTALGDTMREKYESLYVKIAELTSVIIRKGGKGRFWLMVPPEVVAVLETSISFGWNADPSVDHMSMGTDTIMELGILARKWRVYVDPKMNYHQFLIGVGTDTNNHLNFARCSLANFCI